MADLGSTKVFGKLTVIHEAILKANAEITGNVNVTGIITGDGSGLTALNATNLATGTVAEARLPASALIGDTTYTAGAGITLTGTTFALTDESYTSAEKTKLSGIESGATGDQTASEILTAIKTVDGSTSGLDADFLDGQQGSYYLDYNNLSNTPATLPCYMGPTPPTPSSGLLWFDTEDASLNVWYDDGTSGQWVGLNGSDGEAEDVVPITLALG